MLSVPGRWAASRRCSSRVCPTSRSTSRAAPSRRRALPAPRPPLPVDLGPEADQVFLVLFGSGLRARSSLAAVSARIGGAEAQVTYAGPQGDFLGLDQVNVRLARELAGRGEVDVTLVVDGREANPVKVHVR